MHELVSERPCIPRWDGEKSRKAHEDGEAERRAWRLMLIKRRRAMRYI